MNMITLKIIHISNSNQPTLQPEKANHYQYLPPEKEKV